MLSAKEYQQLDQHFRVRLASGSINAPSYEGRIVKAQVAVKGLQVKVAQAKRRYIKGTSQFGWIGR